MLLAFGLLFFDRTSFTKYFSLLLFTKSLLKVCNDQSTTARTCSFGFFNANFELSRVGYCYIFWSRNSYVKNLAKVNGNEIMVAPPSAVLSYFLQNLERILASCSQLYTNCLANLLFIETCSKQTFKTVVQYCLYCDAVLFTYFEHISSFRCV